MIMDLPKISTKHRNLLILTSIATKIFIIFLVTIALHSFLDMHDYIIYYQAVQNIFHGYLPWASGVDFNYPPVAILPMVISYIISIALGSFGFLISMWVLMIVCDIVTTLCVYYIGLKLFSEQVALIAGMLNASALSVAYFVLTRFDAFPTCLAMLAVLTTIYGEEVKGYAASIAGLFTKIWPILLYPFFWIYNSRHTSLVIEGKKRAFWFLLAGAAVFGVMIWAGYNKFLVYASMVYCNTVPYTIFQYFQMAGIGIPFGIIAKIFQTLTVVIILGALYLMYIRPKTIALLLKLILVTLMVTIFFSQYRSPQYIVWFSPFAALLVANDIWGILVFIGVQVLALIEFPFAFWTLYVNDHYISSWALVFFSIFFLACGLLLWKSLKMECQLSAVESVPRKPVPEKSKREYTPHKDYKRKKNR